MTNYLDKLKWRYATKSMLTKKIPEQKLENILEAIRLAPSSLGLQPFNIIVVQDKHIKEKLLPACNGQKQIIQSDAVIVFVSWKKILPHQVDTYIKTIAQTRNQSLESLDAYKAMIFSYLELNQETLIEWNKRQSYIALGFGLAACALEEIDSTPMEGFNPDEVNKILNIDTELLDTSVLLTLGYRDVNTDPLHDKIKVRREKEKLYSRI